MRLIPVEQKPFNAETPMEALADPLTPTSLFYVRSHNDVPAVDAGTWRLTVDGRVARPFVLSLEDLKRRPTRTVAMTMECAGNGRIFMTPVAPGTPWRFGAVSTARFTGTPLHALLDEAGVASDAVEALFVGADQGATAPGRIEPFMRSLPLDATRDPDALLAWAMNDEPLPVDHGHPIRLVVPRWYGVASVKWLVKISLLSRPFEGYYQKARYVYVSDPLEPEGAPVTAMRVRALIAHPVDGAEVARGPIEVAGTAWSGFGALTRVEVSADGGRSWGEAVLGGAPSPHSARPWRYTWRAHTTGEHTLIARATDSAGHTQPLDPVNNVHGYGNNIVHRVRVRVR